MLSIRGRNVNHLFNTAMIYFHYARDLIESTPRGQRRLQYPIPISSMYDNPRERVLFNPVRDCNPFFHFMEALWILGGRNDVAWLDQWLKTIKQYSDNGVTYHGAYGHRLRRNNQLDDVLERLRTEKDTTRAVLQMYDFTLDANYHGKDMPCNTQIFLGLQDSNLNMTVCNRSNDLIWGCYGANVVQFSVLQEYMAGHLGCGVGWYLQFSNNAHIYPDNEATKRSLELGRLVYDPYDTDSHEVVEPVAFGMADPAKWDRELKLVLQNANGPYTIPFFSGTVHPMRLAHEAYREKKWDEAIKLADNIAASDWRMACTHWLQRRMAKQEGAV